jgi:hypothetical protein
MEQRRLLVWINSLIDAIRGVPLNGRDVIQGVLYHFPLRETARAYIPTWMMEWIYTGTDHLSVCYHGGGTWPSG